ncbi:insulinase family protein [Lachnospiraceae bacterium C1.1]|nr:insulinase family protein [Lachnospiraceae bacterium C1.1]
MRKIEDLTTYRLIKKENIPDLNSMGYLLEHVKTGAKVMLLENDDKNKVFTIGFRTPPFDSTGTPHILEHSVLCGSKKFPVKDPFLELAKGSLNTFLNAMTYPDKTVYPIASVNDKDFQNLMDVYLDAVFHPNIYSREEIFRQEGWHYEMENADSPLTINGVVYNEMKGAFSSPDDVLSRFILNSLYPDTQYAVESGGDPDVIPELSYEKFLSMHSKYYHPSNSYIYLYGNCDMVEKLEWIDKEYLSEYDKIEIDSSIKVQAPFDSMKTVEKDYSIAADESTEHNTFLSWNVSIGNNLDKINYLAFQILEYALLDVPGAPLMQALLDEGIGSDIDGSYDNGIYQPYFSVIARKADYEQKDKFLQTIRKVLEEQVKNGIDKKALRAGINSFEFRYREADFGHYPKGLMYGLQSFDSWLYDSNEPFIHIAENDTFAELKKRVDSGWFEELIQKYLLDNNFTSMVILKPVKGLTEKHDAEVAAKLADYKNSLSADEINKIVEETAALKAYQDEPSSQEELESIPMLTIDDIEKSAEKFDNSPMTEDGTLFLHHDIFTNGIAYLGLMFKTDGIPSELTPYLGIFKNLLCQIDTENYSYSDLNNEINLESGGVNFSISTYSDIKNDGKFISTFEARGKFLEDKLGFAFEIIPEILFKSKFDDKKRIKESLLMLKSRMASSMISAGHSTAVARADSYFSATSKYIDEVNGITFYDCVSDYADNFDDKYEELVEKINRVKEILFHKDNLMVDFTGSKDGFKFISEKAAEFKNNLSSEKGERDNWVFKPENKNEGFKTASQVQYVAKAANFKKYGLPYNGALKVLQVMMGYDYLWMNIRVKGGAYGCMSGFTRSGDSYMVSYRDPHLTETIDIYNGAADYLKEYDASERDMTKYVIGAISNMDTPLNPKARGLRSLSAYLGNYTFEDVQKERDEVLSCNVETIRSLAPYAAAIRDSEVVVAVGSEEKIRNNEDIFKSTRTLA